MDLLQAINQFYYDMTLTELRSMSKYKGYQSVTGNISHNSLLYLDLISYLKDCTVSRLAEALQVSKPAVTSKVGELIRQGLVEKVQSTTDKRVHYLVLTEPIKAEFATYDTVLRKAVRTLEQDYSPAEIDVFCRMIVRVNQVIQKEEELLLGEEIRERSKRNE